MNKVFELRCIVRGCQEILARKDNALLCSAGHHFDRAKQGYWPLLQPQDRKSLNAGDSESAVVARQSWLARGHASTLIDALRPWTQSHTNKTKAGVRRIMDLGCGEGTFGRALFEAEPQGFCGIDLSKRAIRLASRAWPDATWVLSNADRILPAADSSVDCVISLFGRRPASEIVRVLAPGANCIIAVPGEEDLVELREQTQQLGHRRNRWESVAEELQNAGLSLTKHKSWQHKINLQRDEIEDALAMTYRAVRHSQSSRLDSVETMDVTLAADLLLFQLAD